MKIDIITLFPKLFESVFSESLIARAQKQKIAAITIHNLRDWSTDKHKTVDDKPFGGGPGMVLKVDVVDRALRDLPAGHKILLTPQGKPFSQPLAKKLAQQKQLILICGHYEGFDERIRDLVDEEISIGDYVLTGGEIPSMAIVDSIVRLIPGVLEKPDATNFESFSKSLNPSQSKSLLEYPQYTHPEDFRGLKVPSVLLSGDHGEIEKWRNEKALEITKKNRPDLIKD